MKIRNIILISILVIIISFIYIVFNYPKAEPEILLIPKNYTGEVIVIFDQKNGVPIEYEKRNRIYHIPENGILFSQFEYNPGVTNQEYYFVDSAENREVIEYRPFMDNRDEYIDQPDKIGITKELTEFYGTDSCILKTIQYIVTSHRNYKDFSCYQRMIIVMDTICE